MVDLLLTSHPLPRGIGNSFHIAFLVALQFQDLFFGEHVAGADGLLQIANTGKGVVSFIVLIEDEPAAALEGTDEIRRLGIFHFPGIVEIEPLEAPQLIAVTYIACHLAKQGVYMSKTLGGIEKADIVMPARQQRIEKQRIDVAFKVSAIHLYAEFVTQGKGHG